MSFASTANTQPKSPERHSNLWRRDLSQVDFVIGLLTLRLCSALSIAEYRVL